MKKWEAVALQEFSQWFIIDVDDDREWIFTGMTLGTFMQPLKDTKEYWIFFVEMIYKLYKCDLIEFPDGEFPIRMLVGTKNLEEFLERVKLFDEAEKLRTFNVIKSAVEHENYCVKFEENKTIRGYEAIKVFGEMLGIAVEEEVVEKVEKKEMETEEEKKLTPQQLRKKYFLKRMKEEDK